MENHGYNMIGEMLIGLSKALQDEESQLRKNFHLSREQLSTLIGVIRIAASPSVQKKYIWELAERWNVTERTIHNWVSLGLIREGNKSKHDTRIWWYADDIDEDERTLIKYGYLKPKKHHRLNYFSRMINGFLGR